MSGLLSTMKKKPQDHADWPTRARTSLANATDPATPATPRTTKRWARLGCEVPPSSIEITSGMCWSSGQYPIGVINPQWFRVPV